MTQQRPRILFVAEAVTLAHVARPAALAALLKPEEFEVHFASSLPYSGLVRGEGWTRWALESISPEAFADALAGGRPLYGEGTLNRYVEDDLHLLDRLKPDVVIGDFRLSLSISCPLRGIPYAALSNAYWSPYAVQPFPIPTNPLVKLVGVRWAQHMFDRLRPLIFSLHARPYSRIRRKYGLEPLKGDLRTIYTQADQVLYADVPGLIRMEGMPEQHLYLGPILWSPEVERPSWWARLPENRPIVYITLGSSGNHAVMPILLKVLAHLDVTVVLATAGHPSSDAVPENVYVADYLPGSEASRRSRLVICNGGSPTTQQALAAGVPVLGICGNLDQHLNMQSLEDFGAGIRLRGDSLNRDAIGRAVNALLGNPDYKRAAGRIADIYSAFDLSERFHTALRRLLA